MSDRPKEGLSPDLVALLRAGRPGAEVPLPVREALQSALLAAPRPAGGDPGASTRPAPPSGADTPLAGGVRAALSAKTSGVLGLLLGTALGAAGHGVYDDAKERSVAGASSATVTSPASAVPAATATPAVFQEAASAASQPPPVESARGPSPSPASSATPAVLSAGALPASSSRAETVASATPVLGRDEQLRAEHSLIEIARAAVGRGNGAAALSVLQQHAREHPRGRMSEEREGLWVQALLVSGRRADARARLDRFRTTFPRSMMLPALERAVE